MIHGGICCCGKPSNGSRAYRIGQKNNVQVYKLITKNSIEEKIYELQEKKSKLIDSMLSTQTTFINKLNKDDIMELFN